MKRVFKFKKGTITDGDEDMYHFLEEYLTDVKKCGDFPIWRENWKVTIIIEKLK